MYICCKVLEEIRVNIRRSFKCSVLLVEVSCFKKNCNYDQLHELFNNI